MKESFIVAILRKKLYNKIMSTFVFQNSDKDAEILYNRVNFQKCVQFSYFYGYTFNIILKEKKSPQKKTVLNIILLL